MIHVRNIETHILTLDSRLDLIIEARPSYTKLAIFTFIHLNNRKNSYNTDNYCKWKLPIGYFFKNKISAFSQAELVKTSLTLTHNAGLKVLGIVCDGAYIPTNLQ